MKGKFTECLYGNEYISTEQSNSLNIYKNK